MTKQSRATPLLDVHRKLGARLTEFAGWEMPLQYRGVIAEHESVRNAAGLFDVTHLGKLLVRGDTAGRALQEAITSDVDALAPGRAGYGLVLEESGGCVDDVFVYRLAADEWLVVPNAANVAAVAAMIERSGATPEDVWDRWAILALQGPEAHALFEKLWGSSPALSLPLHAWTWMEVARHRLLVARTGYTGERGFELYVPWEAAAQVFESIVAAGAAPVGLGARDTLRLEMGYALYGHELSREINPLEAGLGWALAWDTPFRGRDALRAVKEAGPRRRSFAVRCRGKGVPRQGFAVLRDGSVMGAVTSGNYSPTLKTGIALALGEATLRPEVGAEVQIEARGRAIEGDIVKPPFVRRAASPDDL